MDQVTEGWVAAVAPEAPFHAQLNRHTEEGHLYVYGEGSAASHLIRTRVIAEAEVELNRQRDDAEHAQRATHAQVAGQHHLQFAVTLLELEVNAGKDMHVAGRNANVQVDAGAKLQRGFDDLQA